MPTLLAAVRRARLPGAPVHYVNFVQILVEANTQLSARVTATATTPLFSAYRLIVVGSTSQLLKAVIDGKAQEYIVATDNGILHRMRQLAPGKTLIEAPTAGSSATCKSCAHCPWMAMNALQGVVQCLEQGSGEIRVDEPIRSQALGCIERMLDFVARNPGATQKSGLVRNIGAA